MKKILIGICYWIIQLTWGGLLTLPGLLVSLFCILFLKGKVHRNGFSYIVEVGGDWGGLSLGAISLCGTYYPSDWYESTRRHEFGHSLQNIILGPLFVLLVMIPSVIRYWIIYFKEKNGKPVPEYDQAIFEYTASKYGYKAINKIEGTDLEYTFERK